MNNVTESSVRKFMLTHVSEDIEIPKPKGNWDTFLTFLLKYKLSVLTAGIFIVYWIVTDLKTALITIGFMLLIYFINKWTREFK